MIPHTKNKATYFIARTLDRNKWKLFQCRLRLKYENFSYANLLYLIKCFGNLICPLAFENELKPTYFVHLQSELDAKAVVEGRQDILLASSYPCVASSCTAPLRKK